MPVPFPIARLNALHAAVRDSHRSHIPTVYQTHVFAKLHKQNKNWPRFFFEQQWKGKDWMQWRFLHSSWCWMQSFFWQVMQMHFKIWIRLLEIEFDWIIWFDSKKQTNKTVQQRQHWKPQQRCNCQPTQTKQTMPYPSDTQLLPHFSWLLYPSMTSS